MMIRHTAWRTVRKNGLRFMRVVPSPSMPTPSSTAPIRYKFGAPVGLAKTQVVGEGQTHAVEFLIFFFFLRFPLGAFVPFFYVSIAREGFGHRSPASTCRLESNFCYDRCTHETTSRVSTLRHWSGGMRYLLVSFVLRGITVHDDAFDTAALLTFGGRNRQCQGWIILGHMV